MQEAAGIGSSQIEEHSARSRTAAMLCAPHDEDVERPRDVCYKTRPGGREVDRRLFRQLKLRTLSGYIAGREVTSSFFYGGYSPEPKQCFLRLDTPVGSEYVFCRTGKWIYAMFD